MKEKVRICIVCGSEFKTTVPNQKMCSDECRKKHKSELDKQYSKKKDKKQNERIAERIRQYGSYAEWQRQDTLKKLEAEKWK